ncbi:MAG: M90 family metallopeptidase [Rubrivivax sp.]
MSPNTVMLVLVVLALLGSAVLLGQPWWSARRRERIRSRPFPAEWRDILRRRVPMVALLPAALQLRLKRHIQVFVAEKPFIGCQGQAIDDELRVTIAAQACLLLLGDAKPAYFPRLQQVLVYPEAFLVRRERPAGAGLMHSAPQALAGESWAHGQVVLAWAEVLWGAADAADGRNVVLHEFAHQIDQDKGVADGSPWRSDGRARRRWEQVMNDAWERLQATPSPLLEDATDRAELFAVLSEVFFERAHELAAEAPDVYRELVNLYRLDPTGW